MRRSGLHGIALSAILVAAAVDVATAIPLSGKALMNRSGSLRQLVTAGPEFQALMTKATNAGSVRVIAVLDVAFSDPSTLSEADISRQTAGLHAVQDAVIGRVLGGNRDAVTTFDLVPYLVMSATPEQLRKLASDPAVTSIREDGASPPAEPPAIPARDAISQ